MGKKNKLIALWYKTTRVSIGKNIKLNINTNLIDFYIILIGFFPHFFRFKITYFFSISFVILFYLSS